MNQQNNYIIRSVIESLFMVKFNLNDKTPKTKSFLHLIPSTTTSPGRWISQDWTCCAIKLFYSQYSTCTIQTTANHYKSSALSIRCCLLPGQKTNKYPSIVIAMNNEQHVWFFRLVEQHFRNRNEWNGFEIKFLVCVWSMVPWQYRTCNTETSQTRINQARIIKYIQSDSSHEQDFVSMRKMRMIYKSAIEKHSETEIEH